MTDNLAPLQSQTFGYTNREKMASADGAWGDFDYAYDGVGNRTSMTSFVGGTSSTEAYIYPASSNQLISLEENGIALRTMTYDAMGNVTYDNRNGQGYGYNYDAAVRMSSFAINGVIQAEYEYNHLGQQVVRRLTQLNQTIHSVHDVSGKRIAEYLFDENTGSSSLIREYIWANDMLVGVFENGEMYFVRTDHIGRPVFATDDTGTKVWEASYLPFGGVQTSSGPNSDLRFPGQWFQAETGLHQNWMRDYDPTTGRYIQADPLGLVDGASVYGYALQNPGRYTDPRGLQATTVDDFRKSGQISVPSIPVPSNRALLMLSLILTPGGNAGDGTPLPNTPISPSTASPDQNYPRPLLPFMTCQNAACWEIYMDISRRVDELERRFRQHRRNRSNSVPGDKAFWGHVTNISQEQSALRDRVFLARSVGCWFYDRRADHLMNKRIPFAGREWSSPL